MCRCLLLGCRRAELEDCPVALKPQRRAHPSATRAAVASASLPFSLLPFTLRSLRAAMQKQKGVRSTRSRGEGWAPSQCPYQSPSQPGREEDHSCPLQGQQPLRQTNQSRIPCIWRGSALASPPPEWQRQPNYAKVCSHCGFCFPARQQSRRPSLPALGI